MSDGRYHGLWGGEEVIHGVSGVSKDNLIVVLRYDVFLARDHSWVILVIKQLEQVVNGKLKNLRGGREGQRTV